MIVSEALQIDRGLIAQDKPHSPPRPLDSDVAVHSQALLLRNLLLS